MASSCRAPRADRAPPQHVIDAIREREPEILAWMKTNDLGAYQRLMHLKRNDPRSFIGQLVRASRIMDRAHRDPEVGERHRRSQ